MDWSETNRRRAPASFKIPPIPHLPCPFLQLSLSPGLSPYFVFCKKSKKEQPMSDVAVGLYGVILLLAFP